MTEAAWLYAGRVAHLRHSPFRHRFDYRVWMMALDLDRIADVVGRGWMFGHNRLALVSMRDRDHGRRDGTPLRAYVAAALARAGMGEAARIVFVFTPRLLGYSFNPIGWYFCYDAGGRLFAVLHQVKNTFGNQIGYLMPVSRGPVTDEKVTGGGLIRQTARKRMHVSPFFDLAGGYRFALTAPGERLVVSIQYGTPEEKRLTATIMLKARPFSAHSLLRLLIEMPLAPMKVMPAILWQALKIKLRGARFHRMPEPDHPEVIVGDG
jgi:DUF1365 family protein